MKIISVTTALHDYEITERAAQVDAYDRFAVFQFTVRSEAHQLEVANADRVVVTSAEGTEWVGHVDDWDDQSYYVNLND